MISHCTSMFVHTVCTGTIHRLRAVCLTVTSPPDQSIPAKTIHTTLNLFFPFHQIYTFGLVFNFTVAPGNVQKRRNGPTTDHKHVSFSRNDVPRLIIDGGLWMYKYVHVLYVLVEYHTSMWRYMRLQTPIFPPHFLFALCCLCFLSAREQINTHVPKMEWSNEMASLEIIAKWQIVYLFVTFRMYRVKGRLIDFELGKKGEEEFRVQGSGFMREPWALGKHRRWTGIWSRKMKECETCIYIDINYDRITRPAGAVRQMKIMLIHTVS